MHATAPPRHPHSAAHAPAHALSSLSPPPTSSASTIQTLTRSKSATPTPAAAAALAASPKLLPTQKTRNISEEMHTTFNAWNLSRLSESCVRDLQRELIRSVNSATTNPTSSPGVPNTSTPIQSATENNTFHDANASSSPSLSDHLFRSYRVAFLLDCSPSLLSTLQVSSGRILSAILSESVRLALRQLYKAAQQFHLSISVTIVACCQTSPHTPPTFTVVAQDWNLSSVDPTKVQKKESLRRSRSTGSETSHNGNSDLSHSQSSLHKQPLRRGRSTERDESSANRRGRTRHRSTNHKSTSRSSSADSVASSLSNSSTLSATSSAATFASSTISTGALPPSLALLFDQVASGLEEVENGWIEYKQNKQREVKAYQRRRKQAIAEGKPLPPLLDATSPSTPLDVRQLLLTGIFALSRMPNTSCPIMLLFTDGVLSIPPSLPHDDPICQTILQQHITLHVCQLSGNPSSADPGAFPFALDPFSFGYVPEIDLLRSLAWSTGGDLQSVDALLDVTRSLDGVDPLAPVSFRPEALKPSHGGKKQNRHRKAATSRAGEQRNPSNTLQRSSSTDSDDEQAFINSTRANGSSSKSTLGAPTPVRPSNAANISSSLSTSILDLADSGFEFESDQKARRKRIPSSVDEQGAEGEYEEEEEEEEMEQIEDDEEDEEDEDTDGYSDEESLNRDRSSSSEDDNDGRRRSDSENGASQLLDLDQEARISTKNISLDWRGTPDRSGAPSPLTSSVEPQSHELDADTPPLRSVSTAPCAVTTANFFATHPFAQAVLLVTSRLTTSETSTAPTTAFPAKLPPWMLPRYQCVQMWQKVILEQGQQIRKLNLSAQLQSERQPLHLVTEPGNLSQLVSFPLRSYLYPQPNLPALMEMRFKEGFYSAHMSKRINATTSAITRYDCSFRLQYKAEVHIEYHFTWMPVEDSNGTNSSKEPKAVLVTINLVSTPDFIRTYLKSNEPIRVPPIPGVAAVTHLMNRRPEMERIDAVVQRIQTSDLMALQLFKARVTQQEYAMMDMNSANADFAIELSRAVQAGYLLRTSCSVPHLYIPSSLSVLPPSSYLSASHPLWLKISTTPISVLRRWLFVSEPIDIIASLHHTYEVNERDEVRGRHASQQRPREASDSESSDMGGLQNSENGVGTFIISWMELELELQGMQQKVRDMQRIHATPPTQATNASQPAPAVPSPAVIILPPISPQQITEPTPSPVSIEEERAGFEQDEDEAETEKGIDDEYPSLPSAHSHSQSIQSSPSLMPAGLTAIEVPSSPSFAESSSLTFSISARLTQQSIIATLHALLSLCGSVRLSEQQWLIFIPPSWISNVLPESSFDPDVPPFLLIRLRWTTPFLASIIVASFNCDACCRTALMQRLKETIVNSYILHQEKSKESRVNPPTPSSAASPADHQSVVAQLHMFVPGTTGAVPHTPLAQSGKNALKRFFPFGITNHSLSKVCLTAPLQYAYAANEPGAVASHVRSSGSIRSTSRPYMLNRSCLWKLTTEGTMSTALALLRKARMEEGFVIIHSSVGADSSTTYAREIRVEQTGWPSEGDVVGCPASEPIVTHCLLQYCVHQINSVELETEIWMESFNGFFAVPSAACTDTFIDVLEGRTKSKSNDPFNEGNMAPPRWIASHELFEELCGWFHASDLHMLSIVSTFDTVRDLEFSPGSNSANNYIGQATPMQRARSGDSMSTVDSAIHAGKLGLELQLDLDFHADLSFNYRYDLRRRDRLRRHRLVQLTEEGQDSKNQQTAEGQISTMGSQLELNKLQSPSRESVLSFQKESNLPILPPAASLLTREISSLSLVPGLPPSHPGASSSNLHLPRNESFGSPATIVPHHPSNDVTLGLSPVSLYAALLSPAVTPSGSTLNLYGLNLNANSPSVSGSASPLVSPTASGHPPHLRSRSSFSSAHALPASPLVSPTFTRPTHHRSNTDLNSGSHYQPPMHASASQRFQHEHSKKNLRASFSFIGPSVQQELYARTHGASVPLSLTYLLDCSASTPLYFPVPTTEEADMKESATAGLQEPVIIAPTVARSSVKASGLSRSTSLPDQLNQNMKAQVSGSGLSSGQASHVPSSPLAPVSSSSSSPFAVHSAAQISNSRLQTMLVSAVRQLSDLELVSDRVFAQLVNEYTIIFLLLPGKHTKRRLLATGKRIARKAQSQSQREKSSSTLPPLVDGGLSDDEEADEDDLFREDDAASHLRDDVDWYLDCLLASRGYAPIDLSHLWKNENEAASAPASTVRLPELCAALFECNRDEFGHPRTFPFPPPSSLPTFGSLPAVLPPAHALLPLFPPPGPANVHLALLSDGRAQLLPHTYLFLQPRIAKQTIDAYRHQQQKRSEKVVRKVSGLTRQSSLEKMVRSKTREPNIPLQRHQRYIEHQLLYVDTMRFLFSSAPISRVSRQLPSLPHAVDPSALSIHSRTFADCSEGPSRRATSTKPSRKHSFDNSSGGSFLPPMLSLDSLSDVATAIPSPSASSPMYAAASHLLSYHSMVLSSHMRNYVRGVYLNLLEGMRVRPDDIRKAMQVCVAFSAEVDLSNIQTQDWKQLAGNDNSILSMHGSNTSTPFYHFLHSAHAHHRHSSVSLLPPSSGPSPMFDSLPTTETFQVPHAVPLEDSHPLSRTSIVARLQGKFVSLMESQFEPVDGLGLYYYKPPVVPQHAAPAPVNTMLNPRPLSGSILNVGSSSNRLAPPTLLGAAASTSTPPLSRPLLAKSTSASGVTPIPKPISIAAANSGISIQSTTPTTPFNFTMSPATSTSSVAASKFHPASSGNLPFFLQLECVIQVNYHTPLERATTPHNTGSSTSWQSAASGTVMTPFEPTSTIPESPRQKPTALAQSLSDSPASHHRFHSHDPTSFSFATASSVPGVNGPVSAPHASSSGGRPLFHRHLSRQLSTQRPVIVPISVQTCVAEILADIITQKVSGIVQPILSAHSRATSGMSNSSGQSGIAHPLPLSTSGASSIAQFDQLHNSLHTATSVRTSLRLKCLTLRPQTRSSRFIDSSNPSSAREFAQPFSGSSSDDPARSVGEDELGEDDPQYDERSRRPSFSQIPSAQSHSNDYEVEHGIFADANTVSAPSLIHRGVSSNSTVSGGSAMGTRESSVMPTLERLFSINLLPASLRHVMQTLSASIESMVAEEVLHTLLTLQPIQVETVAMVIQQVKQLVRTNEKKAKSLPTKVDSETQAKKDTDLEDEDLHYAPFSHAERAPISTSSVSLLAIPLRFVPSEQDRARQLFPMELAVACAQRPTSSPVDQRPISRSASGMASYPTPPQPQLHAKSLHIHHRLLYYLVDLLPDQLESYHTLQSGTHMNEAELSENRRGSNAPLSMLSRRQTRSSFDANHAPVPTHTRQPSTSNSSASQTQSAKPLPFWLLFEVAPHSNELHVTFHHALLSQAQIAFVLEQFHRTVDSIVHRVNQICLLNLLHATRVCSPLLIPNQREDSSAGPSFAPSTPHHTSLPSISSSPPAVAPSPGSVSSHSTGFHAGDFACPKVLSMLLFLHDRLHPSIAIRNIGPMALHPFTVNNRKNVYVYQEKTGSVFYLKLSTIEAQANTASHMVTSNSTAQPSASVSRRHSGGEDMTQQLNAAFQTHATAGTNASMTPLSPSIGSSLSHASSGAGSQFGAGGNALLLEVFGLNSPGEEITVQLHSLLQSKLSSFTLSLISQMLARNPLFKLTPADHRFIRAPDSAPAKSVAFPLLTHLQVENDITSKKSASFHAARALVLRDPYLFLLYLKQNMERFFTSLCLSYTVDREREKSERENETRKRREVAWGVHASEEVTEIDIWDFIQAQKKANQEHQRESKVILSPMTGQPDAGELVDMKSADYYFVYNNYSNPSPSYLNSEIGKGLSSIYLSLAAPSGDLPLKQLHTHTHAPWNAQRKDDLEQWKRLAKDNSEKHLSSGVSKSTSAVPNSLPSSLPQINAVDLKPRAGGFSSVYDHVTAESSNAEDANEETIRLWEYMQPDEIKLWNDQTSSLSSTSPFWLVAEVWSQGSVNHDAIMARVQTIVNQSMHEYWLEVMMYSYRAHSLRLPVLSDAEPSIWPGAPAPSPTHSMSPIPVAASLKTVDQDLISPLTCLLPSLLTISSPIVAQACVSQRLQWTSQVAQSALEQLLPQLAKLIAAAQPALGEEMIAYHKSDSSVDDANEYQLVSLEESKLSDASAAAIASSHSGPASYVLLAGFGARSDDSVASIEVPPAASRQLSPTPSHLSNSNANSVHHTPHQSFSSALPPPLMTMPSIQSRAQSRQMLSRRFSRQASIHSNDRTALARLASSNEVTKKSESSVASQNSDRAERRRRRTAPVVLGKPEPMVPLVRPTINRAPTVSTVPNLRHAVSVSRSGVIEEGGFSENQHVLHSHMKLSTDLTNKARGQRSENRNSLRSGSPSLSLAAFRLVGSNVNKPAEVPVPIARERGNTLTISAPSAADTTLTLFRHSPIIVQLSTHSLTIWTYNWKPAIVDTLSSNISRLLSWCCFRQQLLRNILHQKLGLFQHSPPVTTTLPMLQRNFQSVGQLTPQTRSSEGESSNMMPPVLGRFSLQNIDLLIQHATPPVRGLPRGAPAPSVAPSVPTPALQSVNPSSASPAATAPSASPTPTTAAVATPSSSSTSSSSGLPPPRSTAGMTPADIQREKMNRQRAQMYSRMRGGGPGGAPFGAPAHMNRGSGRGGFTGPPSRAINTSGERKFEDEPAAPVASAAPTPAPVTEEKSTNSNVTASRTSPVTIANPSSSLSSSHSQQAAPTTTPNDTVGRSRSGSIAQAASPNAASPAPATPVSRESRPTAPSESRSQSAFSANVSTPTSAQPTLVSVQNVRSPIAEPYSTPAVSTPALVSLQQLIYSRSRAFGRLLRGVSPPLMSKTVARAHQRRWKSTTRDPLVFHASQLKQLVILCADLYRKPLDSLNVCWHWIQANTLVANSSIPRQPKFDLYTLHFYQYLRQMSRLVRQMRVPLFFNRIVDEWLEEKREDYASRLSVSMSAILQSVSADPSAPKPPLLLYVSLLDSFLGEYVRFLEKDFGFTLLSITTGSEINSQSGTNLSALSPEPTGDAAASMARPKNRPRSGSNVLLMGVTNTTAPVTLLQNLGSILTSAQARLSEQAPYLPLASPTSARVYLNSSGPTTSLPPLRVVLRKLFHGYSVLLTLEFDGCMVVNSVCMAPLPKLEKNMYNASRKGMSHTKAPIGSSTPSGTIRGLSGINISSVNLSAANKKGTASKWQLQKSDATSNKSSTPGAAHMSRVGSNNNLEASTPTSSRPYVSAASLPSMASTSLSTSFDVLSDLRVASSVYSRLVELSRSLHSCSFLYDFHLRHFMSFVLEPHFEYPPMDLLQQLKSFTSFYKTPPSHSRNHIVHREFQVALPVDIASPRDFFSYLSLNASKYGLGSLQHRGLQDIVFLSSAMPGLSQTGPKPVTVAAATPNEEQDRDRRSTSGPRAIVAGSPMLTALHAPIQPPPIQSNNSAVTPPPFVYLFIAFLSTSYAQEPPAVFSPNPGNLSSSQSPSASVSPVPFIPVPETSAKQKDQNHVKLEYYIMRVDPNHRTPAAQSHPPSNSVMANANAGSSGKGKSASVVWEEMYDVLVNQVGSNAEKTLHRLCNKSLLHYQRDRVWRRLVHGVSNAAGTGVSESSISDMPSTIAVDVEINELDFEIIRALTFRRPLHAIDPQMAELHTLGIFHASGIHQQLFTHLIKVYYGRIRQFSWRGHKHLFIANKNDPDSMIHVIVRLPTSESRRAANAATSSCIDHHSSMSTPYGFPLSWLQGAVDTDSAGQTPPDSSPFKFIACRRQLTQFSNANELDFLTHFTNTVTHFCWSSML